MDRVRELSGAGGDQRNSQPAAQQEAPDFGGQEETVRTSRGDGATATDSDGARLPTSQDEESTSSSGRDLVEVPLGEEALGPVAQMLLQHESQFARLRQEAGSAAAGDVHSTAMTSAPHDEKSTSSGRDLLVMPLQQEVPSAPPSEPEFGGQEETVRTARGPAAGDGVTSADSDGAAARPASQDESTSSSGRDMVEVPLLEESMSLLLLHESQFAGQGTAPPTTAGEVDTTAASALRQAALDESTSSSGRDFVDIPLEEEELVEVAAPPEPEFVGLEETVRTARDPAAGDSTTTDSEGTVPLPPACAGQWAPSGAAPVDLSPPDEPALPPIRMVVHLLPEAQFAQLGEDSGGSGGSYPPPQSGSTGSSSLPPSLHSDSPPGLSPAVPSTGSPPSLHSGSSSQQEAPHREAQPEVAPAPSTTRPVPRDSSETTTASETPVESSSPDAASSSEGPVQRHSSSPDSDPMEAAGPAPCWLQAEPGYRRRTKSAPGTAVSRPVELEAAGVAGPSGCQPARRDSLPEASEVLARFLQQQRRRERTPELQGQTQDQDQEPPQPTSAERRKRAHSLESRSSDEPKKRLLHRWQEGRGSDSEEAADTPPLLTTSADAMESGSSRDASELTSLMRELRTGPEAAAAAAAAPPHPASPAADADVFVASDPRRLAVLQRRRPRPRLLPDVPSPARRVLRLPSASARSASASGSDADSPLAAAAAAAAAAAQGSPDLLADTESSGEVRGLLEELGAGLLEPLPEAGEAAGPAADQERERDPVAAVLRRALAEIAPRPGSAAAVEPEGPAGDQDAAAASSGQGLESPAGEGPSQGGAGPQLEEDPELTEQERTKRKREDAGASGYKAAWQKRGRK